MPNLLTINNLQVDFHSDRGHTRAVDGISLQLASGETLGIVGESGSGKSVTSLAIMRLLAGGPGTKISGEIWYQSPQQATAVDLLKLPEKSLQHYRGAEIAMIFQEPMTSLNPVFRCGHQVTEAIQLHQKVDFETARIQTLALFERVKLPDPVRIFKAYPHEISGGQKQRVMIAMAMSCQPALLIADEPTTALDVTVQKTILELMRDLRDERNLSMLFISHDLGVISEICDRVMVMYRGDIVESGPVAQVLRDPQHPYTKGLVACRPSLHYKLHRLPTIADFVPATPLIAQPEIAAHSRVVTAAETEARQKILYAQPPILQINHLTVRYPAHKNWLGQPTEWLNAVNDVGFEVYPGETFGLAGESGCGKTSLGRAIARLTPVHSGEVIYKGVNLLELNEVEMRPYRRDIQVVFQDPYSSLNPRMTIGQAIVEPMQVHKMHGNDRARRERAMELLKTVDLEADHFQRYPHEFSGGQRQRICIARALALEPKLLICDEMVSALDVSVQATVLNLLLDLREQFSLTYLFISHDLSVVKQMCDRLLIMNRGQVETVGFPEQIYAHPESEYVQKLMDAIPGQ